MMPGLSSPKALLSNLLTSEVYHPPGKKSILWGEFAVDTHPAMKYNRAMKKRIVFRGNPRLLALCRALLALAGAALLLYVTDIGCLFRRVTGVPCPGCGTTRAWLSLFAGRVGDAFWFHPLFWLTPPLLALGLWNPPWLSSRRGTALLWGVCGGYLLLYGVRMVRLFPDTPPMEFDPQAVLPFLFSLLSEST